MRRGSGNWGPRTKLTEKQQRFYDALGSGEALTQYDLCAKAGEYISSPELDSMVTKGFLAIVRGESNKVTGPRIVKKFTRRTP